MADQRMIVLLSQRSVRCTLRKSPADIRSWFWDTFKLYGNLWIRPDKEKHPVKSILNDMFTLLKFVALPNNVERKRDLIADRWPPVKERYEAL